MTDTLLTLYCATADTATLVDAVRVATNVPVHVRSEDVHGRDFDDADIAERVTATLKRAAISCVVERAAIDVILRSVETARRQFPVRWHLTPVSAQGRLA